MTQEQFQQWQDFALRMARTCFKRRKYPTEAFVISEVEDFFYKFDEDDIEPTLGWDSHNNYPEGSPRYSRTYKCPCWTCHGGPKRPECGLLCEDGRIYEYAKPMYVTDMLSEAMQDENPWNHATPREQCRLENLDKKHDWDSYDDLVAKIRHRTECPIHCCLRAGLDCASEPSAGVVGFTVCDIRRMYDGEIPDWVNQGWQTDLNQGDCNRGIWL